MGIRPTKKSGKYYLNIRQTEPWIQMDIEMSEQEFDQFVKECQALTKVTNLMDIFYKKLGKDDNSILYGNEAKEAVLDTPELVKKVFTIKSYLDVNAMVERKVDKNGIWMESISDGKIEHDELKTIRNSFGGIVVELKNPRKIFEEMRGK